MGDHWHDINFPFKRGPSGWFSEGTDNEIIESSIKFILGFCFGDYICLSEFGSDLCSLLFEPNDFTLRTMATRQIGQALSRWEPRISVTNVEALTDEHELRIRVAYTLVADPGVIRFFNDTFTRQTG